MITLAPAMPKATTQPIQAAPGASNAPVSRDSLETKPSIGGSPAIDAQPSTVTTKVAGSARHIAGMRRSSRVCTEWSMTPTIMNRPDLNRAWAMVCTMAARIASSVPTPITVTIRPSWLTVE